MGSSKRTLLLHEPLSRLLPSPSGSSQLLSPRGSQHLSLSALRLLPSSSSLASSQPQEPGSVNDALGQQVVAAEDYVHDPTGDATLSRFQLFQLRKKQEAQGGVAPQA